MSVFNNPVFNSILTGLIVYGTSVLTNNGYPLIGAILTTFPVGIMSMLTIQTTTSLDNFLRDILVGNVIIVLTWVAIYYFSKHNNVDSLALIGLTAWVIFSVIYFLYLFVKGR